MFSSLLALISPSYSIYPSLRSAGRVWLSPARPAWVVSGPFRFIAHARARFVVDVLSWRRSWCRYLPLYAGWPRGRPPCPALFFVITQIGINATVRSTCTIVRTYCSSPEYKQDAERSIYRTLYEYRTVYTWYMYRVQYEYIPGTLCRTGIMTLHG